MLFETQTLKISYLWIGILKIDGGYGQLPEFTLLIEF